MKRQKATIAAAQGSALIPGPPFAWGALYDLAPWFAAMIAVMPMMRMGGFGGSAISAT